MTNLTAGKKSSCARKWNKTHKKHRQVLAVFSYPFLRELFVGFALWVRPLAVGAGFVRAPLRPRETGFSVRLFRVLFLFLSLLRGLP